MRFGPGGVSLERSQVFTNPYQNGTWRYTCCDLVDL